MAVRFIIDSASDILPSEAEELGLIHIPLTITFGSEEFLDAVDLTHREFYEKLIENDELPSTSQVTPAAFDTEMKKVVENGDTAIVVTLSGDLSGTYQSAMLAAQNYKGKVFVVDSKTVCIGERALILYGIELKNNGLSAEEIAIKLDEIKSKVKVLALLDTLEYLKKGGRISSTVALAGGLLSIKPVISVENGKVELAGKARGSKKGNNLLRELVEKCGGIDFSKPYALAYSGMTDALLQKYIEDSSEIWKDNTDRLPITTVGCTIGTHIGPGAVAVAFFEN